MHLSIFKRLFSPLSYFRIRHSADESYNLSNSVKIWYDYYIPLSITLIITCLLWKLNIPFSFFSESGIVSQFSQMLSFLAGFYITALAAIASFEREDLDKPTKGIPLVIYKSATNPSTGKPFGNQILTRREYLCMLFGYLAFMSINLFLIGVLGKLFQPAIQELVDGQLIRIICLFIYMYFLLHIIITTFIGIFYLSERIHKE